MFNPLGFASSSVLDQAAEAGTCSCTCTCSGVVSVTVRVAMEVAVPLDVA